MVFLNKMPMMAVLRFMIIYPMPFDLPQVISIEAPNYLTHLSFRIYSMMFSTTIIGLVLGYLYKPRAWCTVCPIGQLTTDLTNHINKQK